VWSGATRLISLARSNDGKGEQSEEVGHHNARAAASGSRAEMASEGVEAGKRRQAEPAGGVPPRRHVSGPRGAPRTLVRAAGLSERGGGGRTARGLPVTRYIAATVVPTLVYALALASFHRGDLAVGAGLSASLLFASWRFVFGCDGTAPQPAANAPCSGGCGLRAVCRGRLPGGTGGQNPCPGRPRSRSLPRVTGGLLPPVPEQGLSVSH
jgi:hypothetical protein